MDRNQKNLITDLFILMILPFFMLYVIYPLISDIFTGHHNSIAPIDFIIAILFQFSSVGLGSVLVMLIRKESFAKFGVVKENSLKAMLLTPIAFIPQYILSILTSKDFIFIPFQHVISPRFLTTFNFFQRAIMYFIIILVWEFFEAFTYVVINDKFNSIFKPKNPFLNPGAILCAIFVIVIHLSIGNCNLDWDIVCTFITIYGMLVVREFTKNSIGSLFWFTFFWNTI